MRHPREKTRETLGVAYLRGFTLTPPTGTVK